MARRLGVRLSATERAAQPASRPAGQAASVVAHPVSCSSPPPHSHTSTHPHLLKVAQSLELWRVDDADARGIKTHEAVHAAVKVLALACANHHMHVCMHAAIKVLALACTNHHMHVRMHAAIKVLALACANHHMHVCIQATVEGLPLDRATATECMQAVVQRYPLTTQPRQAHACMFTYTHSYSVEPHADTLQRRTTYRHVAA
eukprot:365537-Chlamydomonas_euryale.AAC.4